MTDNVYSTRFWRDGVTRTEVIHRDHLGRHVALLDAATGEPVNFERRPAALNRAILAMRRMDIVLERIS